MSTTSIHDLAPQLAANRLFWTDWSEAESASGPDGDLPIYRTNVPFPLMNGVLRVKNVSLDAAIAEAMDRLAGIDWVWWVGDDSDEGTAEGLLERGATHVGTLPIMAIDVDAVEGRPLPEGLRIEQANEQPALTDAVHAYIGPLGIPLSALDKQVERELAVPKGRRIHLAGIADGKTVAVTTVSLANDVAGIYCVGTHPSYRRRGFATALMHEAMRIAREAGCRIATLQAERVGELTYLPFGYQRVSSYRLFTMPIVNAPAE